MQEDTATTATTTTTSLFFQSYSTLGWSLSKGDIFAGCQGRILTAIKIGGPVQLTE